MNGLLGPYGLIKRIIKQHRYSVGTIIMCEISPTLYAVLVYDTDGNLTASCCNTVLYGTKTSTKTAIMKNLNKVYKETQDKLMKKELVRN